MRIRQNGLLLPEGDLAGSKGALNVDKALVAGTAETEGDVALVLDKGAVNEDVKLTYDIEQGGVGHDFIPSIAGITPHVITQFLLDTVNQGACAVGLQQGVSATQGDRGLVIGDDPHQFVEGAFFPTFEVPRGRVMASRATMVAARQIN